MARRTVQTRFSALLLLRMACFFWKAASSSLLKRSAKGAVSNFDAACLRATHRQASFNAKVSEVLNPK